MAVLSQPGSDGVESLSARIFWVTEELRALLQHMQGATTQPDSDQEERILDDLVRAGLVEDMKTAVDQMRLFLWRCIESAARRAPADYSQQSRRLQQITAMLRILHSCTGVSKVPLSFVEQITFWVDRHAAAEAPPTKPAG